MGASRKKENMVKLFRHQEVALNHMRFHKGFMLIMEQGTGKTLPALCRIEELLASCKIQTALVVCPKSVIASWERDIEKFPPRSQQILKNKLTIINYDKVWRDDRFNKKWDLICLDEAHAIKNRTSNRASFLLKLSALADYRYLLTGTPISNGRLEDWWSLICFIDPIVSGRFVYSKIFKDKIGGRGSYREFLTRFAFLDQYHKPYRYKHIEDIQDVVKANSFRVTKDQCLDLPEKLPDEIITIEMDSKCRKLYNDIAKTSASLDLKYIAENPLTRMLRLRQICSGFFQDGEKISNYKCEKEEALIDFLESYGEKKLVIFAEFKRTISRIIEILCKLNIKSVVLNGDQKDKRIWKSFQAKDEIQVIVCNYASACQGIDLFGSETSPCSTILYYEIGIKENDLSQSRDRIHRNGQTQKCSYFFFLTRNSIEEKIYKSLIGFSDFNEKMFNEYISEYQRSRR